MDVNNGGNLDLFVSGYPLTDKVTDVISDRYGEERGKKVDPLALFLGDGQGGFTDVTKEWNLDRVHLTMGANIGDVDNDGWMDFYLGTGAPSLEIMVPNVLLRNMGGEKFMDATTASGLGHLHKGHGIALGDMDNDGDLDIYAQLGGWYVDSHSQNAMFLNEGTPNPPPTALPCVPRPQKLFAQARSPTAKSATPCNASRCGRFGRHRLAHPLRLSEGVIGAPHHIASPMNEPPLRGFFHGANF